MFVSYQVENVLSFATPVTISLLEERRTSRHKDHVIELAGVRGLRGGVIYGPNASGKTNLVRSMQLLKWAIDSDDCTILEGNQFAFGSIRSDVMSWNIMFTSHDDLFSFTFRSDGKKVIEENLVLVGDVEEPLYERTVDGVVLGKLLANDPWFDTKVRRQAFYLRKVVSDGLFEREVQTAISRKMRNAIEALTAVEILRPDSSLRADSLGKNLRIADFKKFLTDLMRTADIGITDVQWVPISSETRLAQTAKFFLPEKALEKDGVRFFRTRGSFMAVVVKDKKSSYYELRFIHRGGVAMQNVNESDGTIRLLDYSVFLYSLGCEERLWVVDEVDRCLHPFLTRFILEWALNRSGVGSQLLVTTHDVTLMTQDIWRTDEVWFTEKSPNGSSALYSLYQFKPRFDVDIEKRYREGVWGGIPILKGMCQPKGGAKTNVVALKGEGRG